MKYVIQKSVSCITNYFQILYKRDFLTLRIGDYSTNFNPRTSSLFSYGREQQWTKKSTSKIFAEILWERYLYSKNEVLKVWGQKVNFGFWTKKSTAAFVISSIEKQW